MKSKLLSNLRSKLQEISTADDGNNTADQQQQPTAQQPTAQQSTAQQPDDNTGGTTLLEQIQEQGNRPEDWLEYSNLVRDNTTFPLQADKNTALRAVYKKALKLIPSDIGKSSPAYAQLLVNQASHIAEDCPDEAVNLFARARHQAIKFALVHVAAAQFELDQGNATKARSILEKAKEVRAKPSAMVIQAACNLVEGRTVLLTAQEKAQFSIDNTISPKQEDKENVMDLLKPRRSWIDVKTPVTATRTTHRSGFAGTDERESSSGGSTSPLKPRYNKNTARSTEHHKATGATLAGSRSVSAASLLSSAVPSSRMYTDVIRSTPGEGGSDDSASHNIQAGKLPLFKERSHSTGGDSSNEDTVPCDLSEQGVFKRTQSSSSTGHPPALRSYNSTPDCKNASLLSCTNPSSTAASSSVRKNRRPICFGKAMRVKRSSGGSALPEVHEQHESSAAAAAAASEQQHDGAATFTMELLDTRHKDRNKDWTDSGAPMSAVAAIRARETEAAARSMSSGSDSGIMMDSPSKLPPAAAAAAAAAAATIASTELLPISTGSSSSASSCSSGNSTLQATPSTLVRANMQGNSGNASLSAPPPSSDDRKMLPPSAPYSQQQQPHGPPQQPPQRQPQPHAPPPQQEHYGQQPPQQQQQHQAPPPPPPHQQQQHPQQQAVGGYFPQYPMPQQQQPPMSYPPHMMMPPPPNVLTVNGKMYTTLRVIGKGGSCKVWECLSTDSQMSVAIKCVSFEGVDSTTINSYSNEIKLLQRLQHSHRVIKLYDYEHNQQADMLYVVMEKGDTDLATFFRQRSRHGDISPQLLSFYWTEMLKAVQVLHKEGIVHSDLKPANFLLVAGNLKLIDFGIANAIQQDHTSVTLDQQVGTLNYMSPEAIRDLCPSDSFNKPMIKIGVKSDVWSLGCILYYLVYGKTPFQDIKHQIAKIKAIMDDVTITFPPIDNPDLLDTLQMCLIRDPKKRFSIEQLLAHQYCGRS